MKAPPRYAGKCIVIMGCQFAHDAHVHSYLRLYLHLGMKEWILIVVPIPKFEFHFLLLFSM